MIYDITDIFPREPTNPFLGKPRPKIAALIHMMVSPASPPCVFITFPRKGSLWRPPFPGGRNGGTPVLQGSPGRAPSTDWGPSKPLPPLLSALTPPERAACFRGERAHGPVSAREDLHHAEVAWASRGCCAESRTLASHGGPAVSPPRERAAPTGLLTPETSGVSSSLPTIDVSTKPSRYTRPGPSHCAG